MWKHWLVKVEALIVNGVLIGQYVTREVAVPAAHADQDNGKISIKERRNERFSLLFRLTILLIMRKILIVEFLLLLYSCANRDSKAEKYSLQASNSYLSFPIDDDVQMPRFCLWTFEEDGKEYLAFPNMGRDILFYDMDTEQLVKKVKYEKEGSNGVGNIYSFYPTSFGEIYIADINDPLLYVTDTTGTVTSRIRYDINREIPPVPAFFHTITYSPLYTWGDRLYIPQSANFQMGVANSPVGVVYDKSTKGVHSTPLRYLPLKGEPESPYATGGAKISTCFDGEYFVYSHEAVDTIYRMRKDFSDIEKYIARSRFIDKPKIEIMSNANVDKIVKRKCELPVYGNLIYDKYRKVYYRFVFLEAEFDDEKNYMEIYHNGRKQFSIMILDENMKVIGETIFPEYTYNPYLLFINKKGLYLSTSHYKRPDFDENVLRFQKIELIET